jgi:tetratricopeptide (TPR) repeat protein
MSPLPRAEEVTLASVALPDHTALVGYSIAEIYAMAVQLVRRAVALLVFIASSLPIWVQAQGPDDLSALNLQVDQLYQAGKYAEATNIAKKSLVFAETKFGPDHPAVATSLNNLAMLYGAQGRYAEAEALYRRSLAIREKALGPEHPNATSLRSFAPGAATPTPSRTTSAHLPSAIRRWGPTTPT